MSLSPEERQVMSNLEMERAERSILREEVPVQQQAHLWNMLANRLYYAVFHAVSALLIKNSLYANSHKGLHMLFSEKFVRTGIFSVEDRNILSQLELLRHKGDYDCFLDTTEEEIVPYIEKAGDLVKKIKMVMVTGK